MRHLLAFLILALVKTLSHLFYRGDFRWVTPRPSDAWERARLIALLNHTSLYEPLYLQALSFSYLWRLTRVINVPGADVTLNRPLVGLFWKLMVPGIATVSRKRDATWENYLRSIRADSVVLMAPEGRMKRPTGLDKHGRPMTVMGGIADIIERQQAGGLILALSAGLHHVQRPGQHFPRLFQRIRLDLHYFELADYKARFPGSPRERKLAMIRDLQERLERDVPSISGS